MVLNHLQLPVTDAEAAAGFLEKYFGFSRLGGRNRNFIPLQDDAGTVLIVNKNKRAAYPQGFHIGFIQGSPAQVDEIHARMHADGLEVEPPEHHHAYTFYVSAPGGFIVEVLA